MGGVAGEAVKCICTRPALASVTFPSDDPDQPITMPLCEDRLRQLQRVRDDLVIVGL